jgi:glycogen debranching enzyme
LDDILRVKDRYYILANSSLADDRTRVLKHGDTFAVFDRRGDIETLGQGTHGIYHEETRYLSRWVLRLGNVRPMLLSSAVKDDNASLTVDLTNADIHSDERVTTPRGTLHIERSKFLWKGTQYERLRILNYSLSLVEVSLSIKFAADFADIFEVRGLRRHHRGKLLKEKLSHDEVVLPYRGLDGELRRTRIRCSPRPRRMTSSEILLHFSLPSKGEQIYVVTASCESDKKTTEFLPYSLASSENVQSLEDEQQQKPQVFTGNEQFNDWWNRSIADLHMMVTQTHHGPYPYAGVPWFSTAFGRDAIVTAFETLWIWPQLARGVLRFLAATQATEVSPQNDAEPGKIIHETRKGEMAALKEIPFGCYYGSVDSTPLFVMLAGAYHKRTGDLSLIQEIWPNIEAALRWVDEYGDADRDGFVEYSRRSKDGLVNQGWKDSNDSVFHTDGSLAEPPIALCEVQAYVYGAKSQAAQLAGALGKESLGNDLQGQAEKLRRCFEDAFWCDDLSLYALALDGDKRPCRVRASNAGHCLFTGIASSERAALVARSLLDEDLFSGWGVRTLSTREVRYNAMSYHNGSVWPHDNAIIASGFARYGNKEAAVKILTGMLDASIFLDLHRLPELFCGFDRRPGEGPTLYPVACAPQSWAAASVFSLLGACLGVEIQNNPATVLFRRADLPESLPTIHIKNLHAGDGTVDIMLERAVHSVGVTVLRRLGKIDIVSIK